MKNIVFIANNNIGTGLSGGDRIFLEFLRNWQNKASITIFACQETINLIKRYEINNVKIITTSNNINTSNCFSISQLIKHNIVRSYVGIKTILHNKKIINETDFVYSVSDFYPDFLPALLIKLINFKIQWIAGYYLFAPNPFSINSPYKNINYLKGLLYWLMQIPSHLITNLLANIVFITSKPDTKKFPKKRTVIIKGGVDVKPSQKYFKNLVLNKGKIKKYYAVFIGRLHPQKGTLELIDIWKLVTNKIPKARLAIIGNGELEPQIRLKISSLKLNNNIDMLGFLDGKEKFKIFKQSKIVVHPATYDSGGMAAAEAMAWGLPGVSFNLEALKTYYPKGMVKTKCFNLQEFANNIIKLNQDKNFYQSNSIDAIDLIEKKWSWDIRCEEVYNKVFN